MEKRIPASMRTRQSLSDLIEGRLSSPDASGGLVKLTKRLIVEWPVSLGAEHSHHELSMPYPSEWKGNFVPAKY